MAKIFADPNAFVATFANADPAQIEQIIGLIQGMVDQNSDSKDIAIKAFDDAQAASDSADAAEQTALADEWQAVGHWNVTKDNVATQTQIVANKNTAQINLQVAKEKADDDQEAAQMDFDFGSEIIEKEKAKLAEIKVILQQMAQADIQTGRRLLALVKIDPQKLDSVDALIDELVEKADTELEEFTNALKVANEAAASATDLFNTAVSEHIDETTKLSGLEAEKAAAETAAVEKTHAYNEALADKQAKNADLEVKRADKDAEVNRVDGENSTLDDVIGLLNQLLN